MDREEEDQPAIELEDLPTDILESEAETMSTASTSEVDSDLGDRLETLLATCLVDSWHDCNQCRAVWQFCLSD